MSLYQTIILRNIIKIMFDYKIRQGVSKTRNAKYLMKMAGIDIE